MVASPTIGGRAAHPSRMSTTGMLSKFALGAALAYDKARALVSDTHVRELRINGHHLRIRDFSASVIPRFVARELARDAYGIERIAFCPGDIAIDVGANVGIVSIYLAKRHPQITIHALEPIPENFQHLVENVRANGVSNVVAHNLAVTGDGRPFEMTVHFATNSGGATGYLRDLALEGHRRYTVASITLDRLFADYDVEHCRFLKIDCEGAEHEILTSAKCLSRVDYLAGEFHINERLRTAGYDMRELLAHCERQIGRDRVTVSMIRMAE
jgi:FkbM family methyltransferase